MHKTKENMNDQEIKARSLWQDAWRRFKKNKAAYIGFIFIILLVIISVATLGIDLFTKNAIYDKYVIEMNLADKLAPPSWTHPFGQDEFGRDILLRIIWGTRYSLSLGVSTVILSLIVGGLLGAVAGFYGEVMDNIIMRIMDVFLAIPPMLMAISLVAALGKSLTNIVVSIAISYVPTFARVVRASVLTIKNQDYVEAARSYGANDLRIITKYILPNCLTPVIVQATLSVASAILMIASLCGLLRSEFSRIRIPVRRA